MVLLKILRKIKRKEREMRLLMLYGVHVVHIFLSRLFNYPYLHLNSCRGLDNAGKTTIVKKFNGEDINTISPTLGFNIQTLEYKGYKLNIWDVGGQQTIRYHNSE